MAHSFPELIKLEHPYNKLIRVGKSRQKFSDYRASRDRSTYTNIDGKILDKPIQVYRMWYRFLQLALELEEKNVSIVTKMESVKLKTPKRDKWGKMRYSELKARTKKVKVNRDMYSDWDLEIIPSVAFDVWWKGDVKKEIRNHRQLFYPETSVRYMENKNDWDDAKKFTYVQIDNRRRVNDIIQDLRSLWSILKFENSPVGKDKFSRKPTSLNSVVDYAVTGNPNINTLINRFNALILQLTSDDSDKEMLRSKVFRPTQDGQSRSGLGSMEDRFENEEGAYSYSGSEGRAMRDLMLPAKIAILSVCDGYFVKNPNKDYIK